MQMIFKKLVWEAMNKDYPKVFHFLFPLSHFSLFFFNYYVNVFEFILHLLRTGRKRGKISKGRNETDKLIVSCLFEYLESRGWDKSSFNVLLCSICFINKFAEWGVKAGAGLSPQNYWWRFVSRNAEGIYCFP